MARVSIPTPYPGWDFFTTCRAFHPLDHQTIITQTQAGTHAVLLLRIQGPDPVDRSGADFRVILGSGDVSAPALLGRLGLIDAAWLAPLA
jgi:hypothetical protein